VATLEPLPGFDWNHVTWGLPDSPRSALCSYCSAGIPESAVPLILWADDGRACQFCDACMVRWWGFSPSTIMDQRGGPDE
jgi:hypothetical protein